MGNEKLVHDNLGLHLKIARVGLGLQQTALARKAGCSRPSLNLIEHNKLRPSSRLAEKLLSELRSAAPAERARIVSQVLLECEKAVERHKRLHPIVPASRAVKRVGNANNYHARRIAHGEGVDVASAKRLIDELKRRDPSLAQMVIEAMKQA